MESVAFIGLGAMGSPLAARLVEAGYDVSVWNRTRSKMDPLVERGATAAESPADAARGADAVMTMMADPDALRAVVEGEGGIAAGLGAATHIEMSTVGPAAIEWLRSALPEDASIIDAPVLGSIGEAESGSLKVFVGGPAELAERWRPLLSTLGSPMHIGPLGSGAAAKLVANLTLLGTLGLVGEAVAFADGLGLSRDAAFEVLGATPIAAQVERRRPAIESGDYAKHFSLSLAVKDADLIADEARTAGVDLRVAAAAREWFADAEAAGLGDDDYSKVLAHILGGGHR